jgi:hypothetical protein
VLTCRAELLVDDAQHQEQPNRVSNGGIHVH